MVVASNNEWSKYYVGLNLLYKEYITKVWLNVHIGIFKAFLAELLHELYNSMQQLFLHFTMTDKIMYIRMKYHVHTKTPTKT